MYQEQDIYNKYVYWEHELQKHEISGLTSTKLRPHRKVSVSKSYYYQMQKLLYIEVPALGENCQLIIDS